MDNLAEYNLNYLSLLIFLNVVIAVGTTLLMVGLLIRPYKPSAKKLIPYESGVPPIGKARERYSIRFYIIAMLFVLFDIESVFPLSVGDQLRRLCAARRRRIYSGRDAQFHLRHRARLHLTLGERGRSIGSLR